MKKYLNFIFRSNQLIFAKFLIAVFSVFFAHDTSPQANQKELSLRITGIKELKGQLLIAFHTNSSTFPSNWEQANYLVKVPILKQKDILISIPISNEKFGAIIVIHDLDSNNEMTKNIVGFPLEPFGASNNPKFFGPPRFKDALFDVNKEKNLMIKLVSL